MEDRVAQYPGRVRLLPVDGEENLYDMELADEPVKEGTKLNKASLLTDAVAKRYKLSAASAVPNDVLDMLFDITSAGNALIKITAKTSAGAVAPGVPLKIGNSPTELITNASGVVYAVIPAGVPTLVQVYNVIDVSGSKSVTAQAGTITNVTLTVTYTNYKEFTSSTSVRISGACTRLDVTAVGGGGGGSGSATSTTTNGVSSGGSGGGGGGGYVTVSTSVAFTPNTNLSVNIGAAGKGSAAGSRVNGTNGGTTSFLSVSARGGTGGGIYPTAAAVGNGNGGAGKYYTLGSGANGGAGTVSGYSSFTATKKYSGGGGAGAGNGTAVSTVHGGAGGSPYGGAGGNVTRPSGSAYGEDGHDATGYGGGGGGGADAYQFKGGDGYQGILCIRMHH